MKRIFWALILIFFNFNINVNACHVDILPDFAGYLLILKSIKELSFESRYLEKIRPFAIGMTVYCAAQWLLNLFAVPVPFADVLSLASAVIEFYILYLLVRAVADMERSHNADLNCAALKKRWKGSAVSAVSAEVMSLVTLGVAAVMAKHLGGSSILEALKAADGFSGELSEFLQQYAGAGDALSALSPYMVIITVLSFVLIALAVITLVFSILFLISFRRTAVSYEAAISSQDPSDLPVKTNDSSR